MRLFTRISATVSSKLEDMVAHVENHDAIIAATLRETRAAVAKSRVRLERVRKDGQALRQRMETLIEQEKLWTDRARSVAASDEAKALECVARRNQCREQIEQTIKTLAHHDQLENQVAENVQRMEQRLTTIAQQQNMMRSRQSTAEAIRVVSQIEGNTASGIEDTFDRWEMLITETEYANGYNSESSIDVMENAFLKQESNDSLKEELANILATTTDKNPEA
ncbi:MAG: PspA/IM30 family protein [Alphaproteobacteria bacterium]|nr:PspA/IM30 family protein [Alphaproteobacteria bacterium]